MDLTSLIKAVHVRSNYGPDIDLVDPLGPSQPNPLMQALQPSIVIDTDAGPMTIAPYGPPHPTDWTSELAGLGLFGVTVFGLAAYGAYKLITKRR